MKSSRLQSVALALTLLAGALPAAATPITITFSGVFGACDFAVDCAGTRLEPLGGTAFSGEIVIPEAGVDLDPTYIDNGFYSVTQGRYVFPAGAAHLNFTSALPAFSVSAAAPLSVYVHDCQGDGCAWKDDNLNIVFETNGLWYDLALGGVGGQTLFSDAIPSAATIATLHGGFAIWDYALYATNNVFVTVTGDEFSGQFEFHVAPVPLPAAGWLMAGGLLLLRRRHRASNAPLS